jgi:hypothetical protein
MTKLERLKEIERQAEELKGIASNNETLVEALQQVIKEAMVSFKEEDEKENGVDWVPERGENYWAIGICGQLLLVVNKFDAFDKSRMEHHNFFKTEPQAEKALVLIRRSNAIIRACLLVDPDYKPDWSNGFQKWGVGYDNTDCVWLPQYDRYNKRFPAYVSSEEKAQQVCELLTKWGVK